jgi:pimeloyl-ACP methyl ester carboxylesterase
MARFVLVHGAYGGAWCWDEVRPKLEATGQMVETLDLPGSGDDRTPVAGATLESYAGRVCDVLGGRPEGAVLVAHSMGGVVATQAAGQCRDNIASLVFVCAFMPANGQSLLDLTRQPEGADDQIQANLVIEGDPPVAVLSDAAIAAAIYNCCTAEQRELGIRRNRPQPVAPFVTPVAIDDDAVGKIPRSYVLTTEDHSIPPALQRRMISEHPCRRVIELETDHAPYLSATDELVSALLELAR